MTTDLLQTGRRWRRGLAAAAILAGAWGASAGDVPGEPPESVAAGDYQPPEDPRELLRLDDPIRDYFAARLPARATDEARLRGIVDAIVGPDGLAFAYDAAGTFDARETFRRRGGNCVSFAFLVVAVAREFGLEASFQNVERATRWERFGGIVVAVLHLNVRVDLDRDVYVVDPVPELAPSAGPAGVRRIRDETAFAQFYGNIGFQRVVEGRIPAALQAMTRATELDRQCASAWANRAAVQAGMGDLAAARGSYERSLRAEPNGPTALDGMVRVLRRLGGPGDLRRADQLERKARAVRERNPYYQQALAQQAQARGDLATADQRLRRAIALKDDEPEFYAQRMAVLEQLGRSGEARRLGGALEKLRGRRASGAVDAMP